MVRGQDRTLTTDEIEALLEDAAFGISGMGSRVEGLGFRVSFHASSL